MRIFAAIFLALFWSAPSNADVFLYAGAGTATYFPGTLRVGFGEWEFGMLTTGSFGADKIFKLPNNYYAAFGPAIAFSSGFGFYGAFGVECDLFWGLTFRGEMNAMAAHTGFTRGELNAGLGLHF